MTLINDRDVWRAADPRDLWVHDRLILSKMMGWNCGSLDCTIPSPGMYILRPAINPLGNGIGVDLFNVDDPDGENVVESGRFDPRLYAGYFWCEIFEGSHISVDYTPYGVSGWKQGLTVEGEREPGMRPDQWWYWRKVKSGIPFPDVLKNLYGRYSTINCEFIGGRLIEAHLRANPDFAPFPDADVAIPKGDDWKEHADFPYFDQLAKTKFCAAPADGSRAPMLYGWWR